MVYWSVICKTTFRFAFILIFYLLFFVPKTFAATIPYTITEGIPGQFISKPGVTFFTVDLEIDYKAGQIVFSGKPDGTGNTAVDDAAMIWVVERPDGTSASRTFRYDNNCRFISERPPQNVTTLFKPGINKVQVRLFDVCGVVIGSSPLYLVNLNAPEPSKTPLILIPGIGGSELKVSENVNWSSDNGRGENQIYEHFYTAETKVWLNVTQALLPGNDDYFDILRLKDNGIDSEAPIALTNTLVGLFYKQMSDFFLSNGYELNKTLFIFPYDWRLNIDHTKPLLDQKIQQIKQQTNSQKVDIIAHSMGGLVARNYIADPEKAQNVRKLFTLGTPHLGSVKALKTILYGDCLLAELGQMCLSISPLEVKDVFQNLTSGYQLVPTTLYSDFYNGVDTKNHPTPYRINSIQLNYQQIKNLLSSAGYNTSLFSYAESFHELDKKLTNNNGVDITIIVGSGHETLGQIVESSYTHLNGNQIIHKDKIDINGDGTVPLFSASITDPSRNISFLGDAKVYYTNQKHGELVSNGAALDLVKNFLESKSDLPTGVSRQPFTLKNLFSFSVHSPVNIHVYDQHGNHTGLTENGDIEINIPGSNYDTLDDAKFVYVPKDGIYTIKFEATDQGSFDFKIKEFSREDNTQTILYKDISLTKTTKAETVFDTTSPQFPIINVDKDGNNTIDFNVSHFSVLKGDANYDYTPPTINFDISPRTIWPPNNKLVDVKITGNVQDDNPYLIQIIVEDEYDLVESKIEIKNETNINQTIKLMASRNGDDKDGRKYTVKVFVTDLAGNSSLYTQEVIVLHDQRKK